MILIKKTPITCTPLKFWNIEGTKSPIITLNAIRVPIRRPMMLEKKEHIDTVFSYLLDIMEQ